MLEHFIKFSDYPLWFRCMGVAWILYSGVLLALFLFIKPTKTEAQAEKPLASPPIVENKFVVAEAKPPKKGDSKIPEEPKPTINATNSNVLIGPVNAPVHQTINEFPRPTFRLHHTKNNILLPENTYHSEYILTITAKAAIRTLQIQVRAPSIERFDVMPVNSGAIFGGGLTGDPEFGQKLEGLAVYNIQNAVGPYRLLLTSQHPEKFDIRFIDE